MIKFFRKKRYDLMENNQPVPQGKAEQISGGQSLERRDTAKTGKYLKYAIGEIILVMVGILLALQVNN